MSSRCLLTQFPDAADRPTLTVDEVAELLGLSRNSVYDAVRTGAVPSIRIGRRYLVPTARLAEMLGLADGSSDAEPDPSPAQPGQALPS
ncbi:MAG: helix-turn-helix domain-containing protein [Acidimicrobiales bacterium]|jgi:excisionase family DNA binding protein|nr:helix-turn-helix domain-containing protein [Acidimicrobiales bacterium]